MVDLLTTRVGLMLGAVEANFGGRLLLEALGFNGAAAFRFTALGLLIAASEFLFWRLNKVDASDKLKGETRMMLLGGWLAVFTVAFFVVLNNLATLGQLGYI